MEVARGRILEPVLRHKKAATVFAVGAGLAASYALASWIFRCLRSRRQKAACPSGQKHQAKVSTGRSTLCFEGIGEVVKLLERAHAAALNSATAEAPIGEDTAALLFQISKAVKQLHMQLADLAHSSNLSLHEMQDEMSVSSSTGNIAAISGTVPGGQFTDRTASAAAYWKGNRTLSVLSDDSFFSAMDEVPSFEDLDVTLRAPLNLPAKDLLLYEEGRVAVGRGEVACRVIRTDMLNCNSDDDFLAKVYCIRRAFDTLLSVDENRVWLMESGRRLIAGLLQHAKKEPHHFYEAFDRMIEFCSEPDIQDDILQELRARRVCEFNFYDVVLDFILMDAFDDLAQPPSAVLAVTRNRYLSDGLKESVRYTATQQLADDVWALYQARVEMVEQRILGEPLPPEE